MNNLRNLLLVTVLLGMGHALFAQEPAPPAAPAPAAAPLTADQAFGAYLAATAPDPFGKIAPVLVGAKSVVLAKDLLVVRPGKTGIFNAEMVYGIPGDKADVVAPSDLTRIDLPGFEAKGLQAYGRVLLLKAVVVNGFRCVSQKLGKAIGKDYVMPGLDATALTRSAEGKWSLAVKKPLEPGHYFIAFLFIGEQQPAWGFDVQ